MEKEKGKWGVNKEGRKRGMEVRKNETKLARKTGKDREEIIKQKGHNSQSRKKVMKEKKQG